MRAVITVFWGNPCTIPPPDIPTLDDGRTRWACTLLAAGDSEAVRATHAPTVRPGLGWCHGWSSLAHAPRRWSGERKAAARRRNLRRRLERSIPLFADQMEAEELAKRPGYFDARSIEDEDRSRDERN